MNAYRVEPDTNVCAHCGHDGTYTVIGPGNVASVSIMSKRQLKRAYLTAEIGLSEALSCLVLDHGMMRGEALHYLGL